jgi:hypothetical protein
MIEDFMTDCFADMEANGFVSEEEEDAPFLGMATTSFSVLADFVVPTTVF